MITNSLSVCEIEQAIKSIPEQKEHHIFKNHAEQAKTFLFPKCFEGGCYRSFLKDWLKMFPWLLYGRIADGEFYSYINAWNAAMNLINKTENPPSTIYGRKQSQSK